MNVLALHAGALGDLVLALHTVHSLSRSWKASSVTMVARSPLARWAARHGLLAETLPFEHRAVRGLHTPGPNLPSGTRTFLQRFDRIVSFLGGVDDPVSRRLSTLPGLDLLAIDPRPDETETQRGTHITQQWIRQIDAPAHRVALRPATISLSASERAARTDHLSHRLRARPGRIVLCHPGSGGLEKCCPVEILIKLVETAMLRGWNVGWMIGPDELERFGPPYVQRLQRTAPVIYEESVEVAADLVSGADGYIGHDAGMTHVATLAQVPTVALFGPTDPQVWRPLGGTCRVVSFPPDGPLDSWIRRVLLHIGQSHHASHDGARLKTP